MSRDEERGLYEKYTVTRTDGSSASGEKHEHCYYFVLDTDHDPHAKPALLAYADSCEQQYPELARDLRGLARRMRGPRRRVRVVHKGGRR